MPASHSLVEAKSDDVRERVSPSESPTTFPESQYWRSHASTPYSYDAAADYPTNQPRTATHPRCISSLRPKQLKTIEQNETEINTITSLDVHTDFYKNKEEHVRFVRIRRTKHINRTIKPQRMTPSRYEQRWILVLIVVIVTDKLS